jgi:hypothetical protein
LGKQPVQFGIPGFDTGQAREDFAAVAIDRRWLVRIRLAQAAGFSDFHTPASQFVTISPEWHFGDFEKQMGSETGAGEKLTAYSTTIHFPQNSLAKQAILAAVGSFSVRNQ